MWRSGIFACNVIIYSKIWHCHVSHRCYFCRAPSLTGEVVNVKRVQDHTETCYLSHLFFKDSYLYLAYTCTLPKIFIVSVKTKTLYMRAMRICTALYGSKAFLPPPSLRFKQQHFSDTLRVSAKKLLQFVSTDWWTAVSCHIVCDCPRSVNRLSTVVLCARTICEQKLELRSRHWRLRK